MEQCIFCKIIKGEIPSVKVFENEQVLGFKDLHPMAPIHLLFISKNHSKNINDMASIDSSGITEIFKGIREYTKQSTLDQKGFRVVTNTGSDSGQTVFHTHFHVLGGAQLKGFGA